MTDRRNIDPQVWEPCCDLAAVYRLLIAVDPEGHAIEKVDEFKINNAGFTIHSAMHMARDDAHCVMHSHTTAGMADFSGGGPGTYCRDCNHFADKIAVQTGINNGFMNASAASTAPPRSLGR